MSVTIKPWMVAIVSPEEQILFFDSHEEAVRFCTDHDALTTVIGNAIAVFGPLNGVDEKNFDGLRKQITVD